MMLQFANASGADVDVIFAQAKELIDSYEDTASIDYDRVLAWVKKKIVSNISQYTCVTADGEKCAYFRLCEDGELDDLYVLPGFRSQGIGSQILGKCIEESVNPIYLYVFSRNIRAISFYKRFGFEIRETVGDTRFIMSRNS